MSNTVIQIKRSTSTTLPTNLQPAELAYTSNGDVLYIGSPAGANTANVVMIGAKVSTSANTTQLGNTSGGSNTELASTWAIKTYVDGKAASIAGAITDTHVAFSNSGVLAGNAAFTFNDDTLTLTVANVINVGTGVKITNSSILVGNTSVNTYVNATSISTNGAITGDSLVLGSTANIAGTLSVANVFPTVNTSSNLGSSDNWFLETYTNSITGNQAYFANITGVLDTASQPNITDLGVLTGLTVNGSVSFLTNVSLGDGSSDSISLNGSVNTAIVPSANVTYDLGSGSNYWRNTYSGNGYFTNVLVNGDLTVQGTLTTIDTINLSVKDPLMKLADQQANSSLFTDSVDIGFFGTYGNTAQKVYTGLARHATSNTYILFDGLVNDEPVNVVNTNAITVATLNTFLSSGGLTTNSTSANLVANSTYTVGIVANTLTLSTALAVTSGGTGQQSFTNNAVVFGNGTGALNSATGSNGQVLQITGNVPTFAGLDGGTF